MVVILAKGKWCRTVNTRLRGYVLMESMFAMIIVMICFGVGMMVLSNVMSSASGSVRTLARMRLQAEADHCRTLPPATADAVRFGEFTVEREMKPVEGSEHLMLLVLTARGADGQVIAEHYEFICR